MTSPTRSAALEVFGGDPVLDDGPAGPVGYGSYDASFPAALGVLPLEE